jgi:hypothetical protein
MFKGLDSALDRMTKIDWHRHMQRYKIFEYIAYNQYDAMSLQLLHWSQRDLDSMYVLIGASHLMFYTRQTRKLSDAMYFYCLSKGKVLASAGTDMTTEFDNMQAKVGGAVLPPGNSKDVGLRVLSDLPHIESLIHSFVNDVDFASLYPNIQAAFNIAKETKLCTALGIERTPGEIDKQVIRYFSLLYSPDSNAMKMGQFFFGLPSYTEMKSIYPSLR